jgi:hypothetical protein
MSIDNITISKKGRPATNGVPVMVRVAQDALSEIDEWRRTQPDLPSRPEAIRRLVEAGLANHVIKE